MKGKELYQPLSPGMKSIGTFFSVALLLIVLAGCKKAYKTFTPEPVATEDVVDANDETFSIAVIPDTQYYTALLHNGTMSMFEQQIQWIRDNKTKEKIAYVIHLGDVVEHGNDVAAEWTRGKTEMYKLETDKIQYGIAVGNHDQTPNGNPASPGTNAGYGLYFGRTHMETLPGWGGAYGSSNNSDNHYDLFTANGTDYIVLYLEFNSPGSDQYSTSLETTAMNWADGILTTYANRKAIIVSHSILNRPPESATSISMTRGGLGNNDVPAQFTVQGNIIYARMKMHDNVFLMLSGHISGEGFRRDEFNGHVIKTYLADYQSRENVPYDGTNDNGGNGLMRLMRFNKTKETLSVKTFAPRPGGGLIKETDGDSQFTKPLYN